MAQRRDGTPTLTTPVGETSHLERLQFGDRGIDENWLQDLMHKSPEVLPINEIDPGFGLLVPIGREISTAVGPIDNLYVSPSGLLTLVEAKLWRNPQARREVVGQIIDYAKEVTRWSYEELDATTKQATDKTLWELVSEADPVLNESQFVDAVVRNLKAGRFLLLIAGDGIREEMERMAEFLQETPQLRFTLALVELQVYRVPGSEDLLTVPLVVGRTSEVERAVVRVTGAETAHVEVSLDASERSEKSGARRRTLTHDEFFEELSQSGVDAAGLEVAHRLHDDFAADSRFMIDWKAASFSLKLQDPVEPSYQFTILVVQSSGTAYTGWLKGQLMKVGLSPALGCDFVRDLGELIGLGVGKAEDSWDRSASLADIANAYDTFKARIERFAQDVYALRESGEEGA